MTLPWEDPAWLEAAHSWIAAQLASLGRPLNGPLDQIHIRPWSTILRAPTPRGDVYFKASIPLLAGEGALQAALARWRPACTLPVLALDAGRGWFIQPDGGWQLRSLLKTPQDLQRILPLLKEYAEMQIELSTRQDELLLLAPFDRRLDRLPGLFAALLEDRPAFRLGEAGGLTEARFERLRGLLPHYQALCAELAASPIPPSLHHDDFHDGNIFANAVGTAQFISDWGESCVTFPFFSLIVCLRALSFRVRLPDEVTDVPELIPPELAQLRDAYLAPWERFAPAPELLRLFNLAWRAGMVNRALTWYAVVSSFEPSTRAAYADAVPGWLDEFLTLMERS